MSRRKGTKPEQYAGPFQEYATIPERYRLGTYVSHYKDDETWARYRDEVLLEQTDSAYMQDSARTAGASWCEHMDEEGRHHALATPAQVDRWCQNLRDGRNTRTCYEHYYVRIYQFYDYLKTNRKHPHIYNPLLLAAIEYEATREIWMHRIDARPEVVSRE